MQSVWCASQGSWAGHAPRLTCVKDQQGLLGHTAGVLAKLGQLSGYRADSSTEVTLGYPLHAEQGSGLQDGGLPNL